MQAPRAILVDLNETLIAGRELARAVERTCDDLAADSAYPLTASRLLSANREAWANHWPAAEDDWNLGRVAGATLSLSIWREALQLCGCSDEAVLRLAVDTFAARVGEALRLYDDVPEFLRLLTGHVALGLLTNGASDDQRRILASFDLESHFDVVIVSAEVGVAKPDPAIFRLALERLALPAEDVWHVGDSLRADVAGARAAGITAVWLNRAGAACPPGAVEPDLEVSSLSQLAQAVSGER